MFCFCWLGLEQGCGSWNSEFKRFIAHLFEFIYVFLKWFL
uniref:Uncharacterized protein n=1 Tax=Rhizophora mucronata TaxID=61149 RepID=A0A2P2PCU8_RHIMU